MTTCKTCRHWQHIRDEDHSDWPGPHGECELIDEDSQATTAWLRGMAEGGAMIDVSLITMPDFGCNLWSVKTTWVSFDLDWATGDCRDGWSTTQCAWQCGECMGDERGRAQGNSSPRLALEDFAKMSEWLLAQDITGPVIVRDCHADIVEYLQDGDTVLNWDEHSDDGDFNLDEKDFVRLLDCGNWVTLARNRNVEVQQMRGLSFPELDGPVQLFVAVSTPYTSEVCDEVLLEMLAKMENVDFDLGVKE